MDISLIQVLLVEKPSDQMQQTTFIVANAQSDRWQDALTEGGIRQVDLWKVFEGEQL